MTTVLAIAEAAASANGLAQTGLCKQNGLNTNGKRSAPAKQTHALHRARTERQTHLHKQEQARTIAQTNGPTQTSFNTNHVRRRRRQMDVARLVRLMVNSVLVAIV